MTRVLFLKKGGRERTEVVSMQICSHTILHCDDLAWDRGSPETSDRIFTWLVTGRGVVRQEISWNGKISWRLRKPYDPGYNFSDVKKLLERREVSWRYVRGVRPTSKTFYTDATKESRTE